MPQTLTKPVMLDETGQDISSKINAQTTGIGNKLDSNGAAIIEALDDIKDAINNSEFIALMIKVTTPPTKTTYMAGERLDLTGMVVSLVATNGAQVDITDGCTFSPANDTPLTSANTSVSISYYYSKDDHTFTATQAIAVRQLESIAVTTPPTKTTYFVGEALDLTGIVVTATYNDGYTQDIINGCTFNPSNGTILTANDTSIAVSYTEDGITKTTTQALTIKELSSIAVTTPPTKTTYVAGEELDLTGIGVTATYSDGSTADVTSRCTYYPANGAVLTSNNTSVTITFIESITAKTTTQAITIVPIYGVEWDGTATSAWTRTDSAANFSDPVPQYSDGNGGWIGGSSPFDTIQPWAGMVRSSRVGGEMVAIPKFYYKMTKTGSAMKIQIVPAEFSTWAIANGFKVSPTHLNRGDGQGERDIVYVGRYPCTSQYKSVTGLSPSTTKTRSSFRSGIAGLDANTWQFDFATLVTIYMLYLVEFADWNSQKKIGGGSGGETSSTRVTENGYTDSMTYHTGTIATSISQDVYGGVQYRNIEGLWSNCYNYVDGIYYYSTRVYVILNPSKFSETANGTEIQARASGSSGYIKGFSLSSVQGYEWAMIPTQRDSELTGNEYVCDYEMFSSGNTGMYFGGEYASGIRICGLFTRGDSPTSSNPPYRVVGRIMELPANS